LGVHRVKTIVEENKYDVDWCLEQKDSGVYFYKKNDEDKYVFMAIFDKTGQS